MFMQIFRHSYLQEEGSFYGEKGREDLIIRVSTNLKGNHQTLTFCRISV